MPYMRGLIPGPARAPSMAMTADSAPETSRQPHAQKAPRIIPILKTFAKDMRQRQSDLIRSFLKRNLQKGGANLRVCHNAPAGALPPFWKFLLRKRHKSNEILVPILN